jgi:hypothetical protein
LKLAPPPSPSSSFFSLCDSKRLDAHTRSWETGVGLHGRRSYENFQKAITTDTGNNVYFTRNIFVNFPKEKRFCFIVKVGQHPQHFVESGEI